MDVSRAHSIGDLDRMARRYLPRIAFVAGFVKVARQPGFQAKLVAAGVEPDLLPTAAFARQIDAEVPKWKRLVETTGAAQTQKQ